MGHIVFKKSDRTFEQVGKSRSEPRAWLCKGMPVVIMLGLAGLLGRCAFLQLSPATAGWRERARRQQRQIIRLSAKRGSILDRAGRVLACDVRARGVFADPEILAEPSRAAEKLAGILRISSEDLLAKIEQAKSRRFVWLKRDVSDEQARLVRGLGIRGIAVQSYQQRDYPQGKLAGQLLGFTGLDGNGLEGVEKQFEAELAGCQGYQRRTVGPGRRALWAPAKDYRAVRDGANLVLTIDSAIQQICEEQLKQACEKYKAKWGMAVVMDPANGEVLAMANWPSFAPAEFGNSKAELRRNRCVTDVFEPGSTFKCFVASKALEAGLFAVEEKIFCHNGVYRIGGRTLHDHGTGFGELSFEDVVVHSSNIGMAIVGLRMGNERLWRAVRDFGFGQKTQVGLSGESAGLVAKLDEWTSYSTSSVPMGQEIGVTGLQMLRAFCAIANGGLLYEPRIVREVVAENGEVLWRSVADEQPSRALEKPVAKIMRERILADVVQRGTGTRAKLFGWGVFGKTGTSQVAGEGGYLADKFVGSFLGGAPIDEPRVCAMVVIGEPQRSLGYYGGTVAAPAVGAILEQTLGYLGTPAEPRLQERDGLMVRALAD